MPNNNPSKIDTFWEVFNMSRCKTAMLVITFAVFLSLLITESLSRPSTFIQNTSLAIATFWMGRISKAGDRAGK